jgi:hypothetical protein
MAGKRHKGDTSDYRDLNYKQRAQSFTMICSNKLPEYVRVMIEEDVTPARTAREIVEARLETLRKTIDAIARLA